MSNKSSLDERVDAIEERLREQKLETSENYCTDITTATRLTARLLAVEHTLAEMGPAMGGGARAVEVHLMDLQKRYLDRFMQSMERDNKTLAAAIDNRKISEVPTDDEWPRLIPPRDKS